MKLSPGTRSTTRMGAALGLSAAIVLTLTQFASGDVLKNEVSAAGGVGGKVTTTVDTAVSIPYYIQRSGGDCDASDGSPAIVTITASTGATVDGRSSTTLTFDACEAPQSVVFKAGAAGTYAIPSASVSDADSTDSYTTSSTAFNLVVEAPAPDVAVNHAPTVAAAAGDQDVAEGDTISVSGRFADEDLAGGDSLTLSATNTAGTFTPGTDGSWTFTLPTTDDVASASIVVTATDSHGVSITDDFTYQARNVVPSVSLVKSAGDALGCTLNVSTSWTDPGSADTHTGVLSWGDTPDTSFTAAGSYSHTFASAGTYPVTSTVTDDDGGVGSASLVQSHRVFNKPSGVLQPVNDTRLGQTESQFKLGSTIPVKITATSCAGQSVAALAPQVSVKSIAASAVAAVDEAVSTATPTTGTTMRYDAAAGQYIYNLATKQLAEGHYQITITDPSFPEPVVATMRLKK